MARVRHYAVPGLLFLTSAVLAGWALLSDSCPAVDSPDLATPHAVYAPPH